MSFYNNLLPGPDCYGDMGSSRLLRNKAEKQRRDRVAKLVNEMGEKVPLVKQCAKRPDKITILRLSASFLRQHHIFKTLFEASGSLTQPMSRLHIGQECEELVLEHLGAMFFVLDQSGKIVYVHKGVENYLGHQEVDLLGLDFKKLVHEQDHQSIQLCLKPDGEPFRALESIASSEDSSSDDTGTSTSTSADSPVGEAPSSPSSAVATTGGTAGTAMRTYQSRSFRVHVHHKATGREEPQWERVQGTGKLILIDVPGAAGARESSHGHRRRSQDSERTVLFAFAMQLVRNLPCPTTAILPLCNDEYKTRHTMDGCFIESDHRIAFVSGYMQSEVVGSNAFQFMHPKDGLWAKVALEQMFKNNIPTGFSVYRLRGRNGAWIFLRTEGFLEKNPDTHAYDSFVCINKRVTRAEAIRVQNDMRRNLSAIQDVDQEALAKSPKFIELPDDTPADTFADDPEMPPRPPETPQRVGVIKRTCKRAPADEPGPGLVVGGDLKRVRFGAPDAALAGPSRAALPALPVPPELGLVPLQPQRAQHPAQRVAPMLAPVPVPVLVPTPGMVVRQSPVGVGLPSAANPPGEPLVSDPLVGDPLVSDPNLLGDFSMGSMGDALGPLCSVLDLPGDLVGADGELADAGFAASSPSSSSQAIYQVHDMVYQLPKEGWGRPESIQGQAEPTLNLEDNLALYPTLEAPLSDRFPAQGVIGMSVQPLQPLNPLNSLKRTQQHMANVLENQNEEVLALQQDMSHLPNRERSNLNNKLSQFEEERSRHKKQLEDLSRQTELFS
ncbi:neuronal PAS domain-containing protein 1-like isoform X2 [Thrips palmi]|uniref:Neuronal PAS domain-containing protein 1-like isoform X2 n=1 Tax=Thrips palmi TaxID=161013 RepID=A0A6P9A9B5_THRPL|nr:neuronal PAS domain-containing protein 1-like isoform X2 [Thrips palmi]